MSLEPFRKRSLYDKNVEKLTNEKLKEEVEKLEKEVKKIKKSNKVVKKLGKKK